MRQCGYSQEGEQMDVRRQFSQVEVQVSAVIHAPIRRVWASISRFGDIGDQNSADASNANGSVDRRYQRLGARRVVYIGTGRLIEELTALDNEKLTLSYKLVNDASNINPFPASFLNNRCTIKLRPITVSNQTFVDIQSRFMTDHAMADSMEQTWERMYISMLVDLNRHMTSSAAPQVQGGVQQQAKPPMGAGSKRDFQMMASPAQQPLAYPGQAQVAAAQAQGGSGSLPDGSGQQMAGMLSMPPAQPASSFTNGPSFPSSPFAAAATKHPSSGGPMSAAGPSNSFPPSSLPYQEQHQATLHTMASSSSAHTQHLYSTGSSMLQALGSGGGNATFLLAQQQQRGAAGLQQEQGMGQAGLRGQPPPFAHFPEAQPGGAEGGPHTSSQGMLGLLEGSSPCQGHMEGGVMPNGATFQGSCMDSNLQHAPGPGGAKPLSPGDSASFRNSNQYVMGTGIVNTALMSRLMEMIHLPGGAEGHAGAAPGAPRDGGGRPQHCDTSLLMDCELTAPELNNIQSRLAHEVASGNSSTGSGSPGEAPPGSSGPGVVVPMQMSSPFGAASLQRNMSTNLGVSTPDQGGEPKFLGCPG